MQKFMEGAYNALNRVIANVLRPYAISTREWIKKRRERREDKHEELITTILNWRVQGEAIVTVPNLLSVLRPFLITIAMIMQTYGVPWYFVSPIVIIALLTDKFDGAWAEIDGHTAFGEWFDPLCDKVSLIIIVMPFLGQLSHWVIFPMIGIELFLLIIALVGFTLQGLKKKENTNFRSNIFGKVKFSLQAIGILLIAFSEISFANILFAISLPFAIISIVVKAYTLSKP
ncbi:MAG: CDP-alcohol phosphatidyltransferase family protein [Candidatus Paceibacterota bacterium]|jgi:phosphatidylglycerophosphate synthase